MAAVLVALLSLTPSPSPRAMLYGLPEDWADGVRDVLRGTAEAAGGESPEVALHAWARRETPESALFLTDSLAFRTATLRSTTGTFKDGGIMYLVGTRPFLSWHNDMERLQRCKARKGEGCWFALARATGAEYAIVDPDVARAGPTDGFTRVWARGRFSVWRADAAPARAGGS